jgi:galactokinase
MHADRKSIEDHFREAFQAEPEVVVRAPGRVNLIGEHTDYNQGFVLPAAIDRYVWYAGRRRAGRKVRALSLDFNGWTEFDLDHVQRDNDHPWSNYLRGVSKFIETENLRLPGADLVLGGNIPREAGLSSSAAVEVGAAVFWQHLMCMEADPVSVARLTQKAENDFVGVPCGIMDQFISALGRKDHALFLDCRDLTYRHVPLRPGVKIVVCNTGVKRALAHSEYEARRDQCAQALARLRSTGLAVSSLRDVEPAELEAGRQALTEILFRRARHVVTENLRVLSAVQALERNDLERFGVLMNDSHASLRDDYEVSSPELDLLADLASKQPGLVGARMTGAGFGGCTVNLVRQNATENFVEAVSEEYERALGFKAEVYVFEASDGALATSS